MKSAEDLAKTESAATLAARIRRKEVSPVEILESAIERIETHNPKINALVIFGYDDARKAAKAAEAAIHSCSDLADRAAFGLKLGNCTAVFQ